MLSAQSGAVHLETAGVFFAGANNALSSKAEFITLTARSVCTSTVDRSLAEFGNFLDIPNRHMAVSIIRNVICIKLVRLIGCCNDFLLCGH